MNAPPERTLLSAIARMGYAARGAVYVLIGGLATLAALGAGGETTDTKGALRSLLGEPFGEALLALIGAGLAGLSLWRLIQVFADADHHGTRPKGLIIRGALAISAAIYGALSFFAFTLVFGWQAGGRSAQEWIALAMDSTPGRWLVGLIGAGIVIAGGVLAHNAWKCAFLRRLECDARAARWIRPLGRAGYAARGVVFGFIGAFLIAAAWHASAGEARGMAGALKMIHRQQPYGEWLLGLVAAGLLAFGLFGLVQARYRRVDPPPA